MMISFLSHTLSTDVNVVSSVDLSYYVPSDFRLLTAGPNAHIREDQIVFHPVFFDIFALMCGDEGDLDS